MFSSTSTKRVLVSDVCVESFFQRPIDALDDRRLDFNIFARVEAYAMLRQH
jgi:hypothetical protein